MIPDEAVEAAAVAIHCERWPDAPWGALNDESRSFVRTQARAALEAAAPRIAAQAVREAADAWREYLPAVAGYGKVQPVPVWLERRAEWIG